MSRSHDMCEWDEFHLITSRMELQHEDLEADAAEDDIATEVATAKATSVTAPERKRPSADS